MNTTVIDFHNIQYLQQGTTRQQEAYAVLTRHRVMELLVAFDPILAGTIPLNIDIAESDLDVICFCPDKKLFIDTLLRFFGQKAGFLLTETTIDSQETVIANCVLDTFALEIFGQPMPTTQQNAYRHMVVEHQILCTRGENFRREIIRLKQQGYKTEPAFAQLLGLPVDDAYNALLHYTQHL